MPGTRSLGFESATLIAGRTLTFAISFLVPLILVRVLAPEQFGLYKQLMLVHGTLTSLFSFGLGASLFYFVPRHHDERHLYIFHTLLALTFTGLLAAGSATVFKQQLARALNSPELEPYLPALALFAMLSIITGPLESLMIVLKQVRLATLTAVQSELLRSALMIPVALWTHNVFALVLAGIVWGACRLIALLTYARYLRASTWLRPRWRVFRQQFAYSIPFAAAVLVASLNETIHQYAVSYAYNPAMFAIYSIGYLQIPFVSIVFDSVSDITLVRITELIRDHRLKDATVVIAASVRKVALFLLPAYAWLLLNAKDLIVVLFTARFEPSAPLFQIFLTLIPLTVITTDYVLRGLADTAFIFWGYLARFVASAALLVLLIPPFGLTGAALATVLAAIAHRAIVTTRVSRSLRVSPLHLLPWTWLARLLFLSLALAGLAHLIATLATERMIAKLALSGGFFAMAYGLIVIVLEHDLTRRLTGPLQTTKYWLKAKTPRLYSVLTRAIDQIIVEYRAIRRMGVRHFVPKPLGKTQRWKDVLPMQTPRRIVLAEGSLRSWQHLVAQLQEKDLPYAEGGHTIYLPPQSARQSVFAPLLDDYPLAAGIKLLKYPGSPSEALYVDPEILTTRGESRIHHHLVHTPPHLILVANLLYLEGIGMRLFDLVDIRCGPAPWTAYIVEHIDGGEPSLEECEAGIEAIRRLEKRGLLRVILPEGFKDPELSCPSCGGNALATRDGAFKYIDFQNFRLINYDRFLKGLVHMATKDSHFGDCSIVRGGRYLYQAIPSVNVTSKRDTQLRIANLRELMDYAGVSVVERLVLDIGCNIGAMMAEYLKSGAKWCIGWDKAHVAVHTNQVLLALGCTRFSVLAGDLHPERPIYADIPDFLRASLPGCVISYLAVRGHLGWIDALQRIPWAFMIYEGHEGESLEDFNRHVVELNALVPVRIAEVRSYTDGDSSARLIALLMRVSTHSNSQ